MLTSGKLSLFGLVTHFFIKEKFKVISLICLCMLWGSLPVIDNLVLKNLVDSISYTISTTPNNLFQTTMKWALIYFFWWEASNIYGRFYDYMYLVTLPVLVGNVVDSLTNYTKFHSQQFFNTIYVGDISQTISLSALAIEDVFSILIEKLLLKIFLIFSVFIALFSVSPYLAGIFIIWLALFLFICFITAARSNKLSAEYARKYNKLAGLITDMFSNIYTVQAFNGYLCEENYLKKYIKKFVNKYKIFQIFMTKTRYFQSLSCSGMIFFMICTMSQISHITVGDYVLVTGLCVSVADSIEDLIQEISDLYENLGIFTQCRKLLVGYDIKDKENAKDLEIKEGKIEYNQVHFQYQKSKNLFKNKSIIINGGTKIGLVGFSGSGKTSFANLITRIYQIYEGQILIDGQNINDVTLSSLRNNISIIPQNPTLFNRTISENIKYGTHATDKEMIEAAKKSYIHDYIESLPEKYDTDCGCQSGFLSGSQKQRIVIARAMLKNSPILILDEATSNLDSITEKQIQDSLKSLMRGKTVIVIAHKLSTLIDMDRILVFDNGRIVEDGVHAKLLEDGKLYSKFWNSQIRV